MKNFIKRKYSFSIIKLIRNQTISYLFELVDFSNYNYKPNT
jgi:hypothetical protein